MKYLIQIFTLSLVSFLPLKQLIAQNISSIDPAGKWIVNGDYFLPMGFYTEALSFDDYPNLAQQVAAGGFNYIYAESYPVDPSEVNDYMNKFGDFLNDCDSLNVEVVCGTVWQSIFPERFQEYVNFLKTYPALIAWNLMDDANGQPLADVINQRHYLDSMDDLATRVKTISFYGFTPNFTYMAPHANVAYMQSYPWGLSATLDMADAEYLLRNHVVKCQELDVLPIASPQTFNWGNQSYPSAEHVDCQSYLAFIVGNKGILYYTFKDYDLNSTIDVTHPEVFNAAANVADEVLNSELKDVILHGQHTYYILDRHKYYATWEYNNQFYLMAVNGSANENIAYDIPLPQYVTGSAINLFPNRPDSLTLNNNMLSGELAPFQVAIYKMQTTLSTDDNKHNEHLKLFPNPTRSTFKISGLTDYYKVEILDFAGRKVSSSFVNPDNIEINIQSLQKGAYLVNIISIDNNTLIQTLKLIKE